MSATIGDGITALALAGGIVGYLFMKHQSRQKKVEIIHQERMAAMEKGIQMPEFPLDPAQEHQRRDANVIAILGMVLSSLSVGAMIVLYLILPASSHSFWVSPLPIECWPSALERFPMSTNRPYGCATGSMQELPKWRCCWTFPRTPPNRTCIARGSFRMSC
jgi:hypothetical protein